MAATDQSEPLDDDAEHDELHEYEDAVSACFTPDDWDVLWRNGYHFVDVLAGRVPGIDPRDLYDQIVKYAGEADAPSLTVDLSRLQRRRR